MRPVVTALVGGEFREGVPQTADGIRDPAQGGGTAARVFSRRPQIGDIHAAGRPLFQQSLGQLPSLLVFPAAERQPGAGQLKAVPAGVVLRAVQTFPGDVEVFFGFGKISAHAKRHCRAHVHARDFEADGIQAPGPVLESLGPAGFINPLNLLLGQPRRAREVPGLDEIRKRRFRQPDPEVPLGGFFQQGFMPPGVPLFQLGEQVFTEKVMEPVGGLILAGGDHKQPAGIEL